MNTDRYIWTDNPMISEESLCDTDIVNDCLMHLKYNNKDGSGLQVGDIGLSFYVDETKGLRRYLNGSLVDINENTQGFLDRLNEIRSINPNLFVTEEEWQTIKSNSINGLVDKFVINETNATIRLPKFPDYIIGGLNSTAPVKGNGMTLGLTNGTNNMGMTVRGYHDGSYRGIAAVNNYGGRVGEAGTDGNSIASGNNIISGITTDASKSGMVTVLSSSYKNLRFYVFGTMKFMKI